MIKLYEAPKDPKKYHIVTDEEVIQNLEEKINSMEKDHEYMVKRCNYLEKENARLNYQRDMYRHGLVEISELSENQLNDGTAWDIARYCISSYKAPNNADIFMDELSKKIARLQEQLNEANEVIKTTNRVSGNIDLSQMVYEDRRKIDGITMQTGNYLEKWG